MGVDVESKLAQLPVETGSENGGSLKENGVVPNEPIKFGSHGTEEPKKEEVKKAPAINLPKDVVVEDWPAPQQIHSFYFVKYRSFEDQKLKVKLEQAEKELQRKNQARSQMIENLKAKKAARSELINEHKSLHAERQQFRSQIDEKFKVIEPLQQALGKLRGNNTGGGGKDRDSVIFSSEAELNDYIKSLENRMQHESIDLKEEKQILREIKQLQATREKVIANAAERAKIQESLGGKESIQSQVKLIGVDLDGAKKEKAALSAKLKDITDELEAMKKEIESLGSELDALTEQREKTYENIREIKKQREQGNSSFFQFRKLNLEARQLADKKEVDALRELSKTEVDKFMTQWSSSKAFRDDYEKRIVQSLDMRQLSKDGRMRNPNEKPLVLPETPNVPAPAEPTVKTNQKPLKEDSVAPQQDSSVASKAQKEKNSKQSKDAKNKTTKSALDSILDDDDEIPGLTNLSKDSSAKKEEVDEETLKRMKREEEIAKNKQAMERKKKLAEKAAAKAALKAQKEAEKKLKDQEKKAKKKAGGAVASEESTEDPTEKTKDADSDKAEEKEAEVAVEPKIKERKVNSVRQRSRPKSDIQKVLLKRKKGTNYWMWAGPAAGVVILILLAVGYKYFA